jgi:hypothetical protein
MDQTRFLIRLLLGLTILLGIGTIYTISSIVPSFVVDSASVILVIYVVIFLLLLRRWNRGVLVVPVILSIFTIVAVFSTTQHIKLIEEGYLPAIIIISSGMVLEVALFISSVFAIWKRK